MLGLVLYCPTISQVKFYFPFDFSFQILSGHLVTYMTGVLVEVLGSDKAVFYPPSECQWALRSS